MHLKNRYAASGCAKCWLARLIAAFPNDEQNPKLASILSRINTEKHGIHALT